MISVQVQEHHVSGQNHVSRLKNDSLFEGKMAEVECITLDEDEDHDHLPGAGRIANHPQMVCSYLVLVKIVAFANIDKEIFSPFVESFLISLLRS